MKHKNLIRGLCIALMVAVLVVIVCMCSGCNQTLIDTVYRYDRAIIEMPGGEVIEVEIKSWSDYDGEQLQIISTDGTVYLVSSFNCVLIQD